MNDTPSEVAVEQWIWFHQVGMTNREIMSACQMHYEMGMTVDEVIDLDLAYAPPFSGVWDAVHIAARKGAEALDRTVSRTLST